VNVITSHHGIKATRGGGEQSHPTGLVTTLGGTVVKEGVTTVHETSVIGTYISGKYAQVLQSSSRILQPQHGKPKPTPSSSLRILKTAAPVLGKSRGSAHLEPTPAGSLYEETVALPLEALFSSAPSSNFIKSSRRPGGPTSPKNSLHSRFHRGRGRETQDNREQELGEEYEEEEDDFIIAPSSSRKATSRAGAVKPTQSVRSSFKSSSKNAYVSCFMLYIVLIHFIWIAISKHSDKKSGEINEIFSDLMIYLMFIREQLRNSERHLPQLPQIAVLRTLKYLTVTMYSYNVKSQISGCRCVARNKSIT
jgi:hypothetical protein